jgi:CMP-N,N'-diacetyllegionaminic acid synthase
MAIMKRSFPWSINNSGLGSQRNVLGMDKKQMGTKPKILAVIPARGGSKGVVKKNIRMVAGKPLLAWTIEAAHQSKYIGRTILSSDDTEIIRVAEQWNCDVPFIRPSELAQDDTPGIMPVLHAIETLPGYDYVVLLQVTSPLRTVEDIDHAIKLCLTSRFESLVSVVEPEKSPYWMYSLNENGEMEELFPKQKIFHRQQLPATYAVNGAIYLSRISFLKKEKALLNSKSHAYVMPKERSLDIDSEFDLRIASYFLSEG